ncbi:MAG: hypothetical protein N3A58_02230 [Spirochaetes bacterium]|nr:hypothetical protein [Spirochaetota bacterium]
MIKEEFSIFINYNLNPNTIQIEANIALKFNLINSEYKINLLISKSLDNLKNKIIEKQTVNFQIINNFNQKTLSISSNLWKILDKPKIVLLILKNECFFLIKKE